MKDSSDEQLRDLVLIAMGSGATEINTVDLKGSMFEGVKPFTVDELVARFKQILEQQKKEAVVAELEPLLKAAEYESARAERKDLHSNVDGVLIMIENSLTAIKNDKDFNDV